MSALKHQTWGYAYIEVLIAVVLVATCLAPMVESLAQAVRIQTLQTDQRDALHFTTSLMEQTLSTSYQALDAEAVAVGDATATTSYSDPTGTKNQRLVYLARYDVDNADADNNVLTGGDPGLIWIRVTSADGRYDLQNLMAAP